MGQGLFVTFEGIDGSGKSTQSRLLAQRLTALGHQVVLTREPGGSDGAEEIRRLLVEGETDRWSAETEILLFTAARRDHLERTIRPALTEGKIVLCDRFADSTRVYQGVTRGDLRGMVDELHSLIIGQEPDLTLIVDMDPVEALKRGLARKSGEDRFEEFGEAFQIALKEGFLKLAADYPARCRIINGNQPPDDVAQAIFETVEPHL